MILRADWVVPVDAPALRDAWVQVADGRIAALGQGEPPAGDAPPIELHDALLLPGLVNPHTHLELTCYAGRIEPAPLWTWLERLIALRREPGAAQRERQAVCDGAWRSLRAGVTCVGDISRTNVHWRELKRVPIRKVCFVELLSAADHPPRDPQELLAAFESIEEDGLLTAGVSPHAPYTVPADQVRACVELATRRGRAWCMHWAETPEEAEFLRGRLEALPPLVRQLARIAGARAAGANPAEHLARCCGGLAPGALAHVNYADDADAAALAAAGHVAIYCPRAHAFFGHAPHPLAALRAAGVTLAIGTDSLASNQSLSMFDELRYLSRARPDVAPADALRMATLDAARALRLDGLVGSITPGKRADLVAVRPTGAAADDPVATVVREPLDVLAVWVDGERVAGSEALALRQSDEATKPRSDEGRRSEKL